MKAERITTPEEAQQMVDNCNRYFDGLRAQGIDCDGKLSFDGSVVRLYSTTHWSDRIIDVAYRLPIDLLDFDQDLLEAGYY